MSPADELIAAVDDARQHVSAAYEVLDRLAAELEEPERHAALTLRGDLSSVAGRLKNLRVFIAQVGKRS